MHCIEGDAVYLNRKTTGYFVDIRDFNIIIDPCRISLKGYYLAGGGLQKALGVVMKNLFIPSGEQYHFVGWLRTCRKITAETREFSYNTGRSTGSGSIGNPDLLTLLSA